MRKIIAWTSGALLVAVTSGVVIHGQLRNAGVEQNVPNVRAVASSLRWLMISGGADPSSNQVSLEQDTLLAAEIFGAHGKVLFGGGEHMESVQVLDSSPPGGNSLRQMLGDILDPRDGRDAHYRRPRVKGALAATASNVSTYLNDSLGKGKHPFLVYIAGHGDQGETPAQNSVGLWGGHALSVSDLAATLDTSARARQVRVVVAACYSGGFGHLAFAKGSPELGPAHGDRCGFFASTWDRESSGCDPNPDRHAQEGYSLYFLNALRGQDRHGKAAPIDLDHDGKISLLEAHTYVRMASESIDVPTTTSEAWLRHVTGQRDLNVRGAPRVEMREDEAVISHLSRELRLDNAIEARKALEGASRVLETEDADLEELESELDERYADVRIAILERWPLLDDPWHRDFPSVLAGKSHEIKNFLATSPLLARYQNLENMINEHVLSQGPEQVRVARITRLVRAWETLELAAQLKQRGGGDWAQYQKLLRCERSALP